MNCTFLLPFLLSMAGICQSAVAPTQSTAPIIVNGSQPAVSPDGSHIAFVSNRSGSPDVFIIAADATGETQLTHSSEDESNLQWNPKGNEVVFAVFANDTSRIYGISLDGKKRREIGTVPGRAPVLAPDGKRLVYMTGTWTAPKLFVSALDGSNPRQITDGSSIAWNSRWSPDGKRIAFTGRDDSIRQLAVLVMNDDGSDRQVVSHIPPEVGRAQGPRWSPDGHHLAFQVNTESNMSHIWILDLATGTALKLAAHDQPYLDESPSWFPDGKRLAFQSNRSGRMEIWIMNADGSGQRQLTGKQ